MLLGRIIGRSTTRRFTFEAKPQTRSFDYVQAYHPEYEYVLAQVVELEQSSDSLLATCQVIGYKADGAIEQIRSPLEPGTEVLRAQESFISEIVRLPDAKAGAFIGRLDGQQIDVRLDLHQLLTKHVSILAKSGAGKSYTVGVLLEEILDKRVPVLIIDPHGEHASLAEPNDEDSERLAEYGLSPAGFEVVSYGDASLNEVRPLRLPGDLGQDELIHLFPGKLNSTQMGILYSAIKSSARMRFPEIILSLEQDESNAKWSIIRTLEHLHGLGIFSDDAPAYQELLTPGQATILNLRGIAPDVQEIIAYKTINDLFALRKQNKVPPFFLVVEEAHTFCPERSFGEAKSSKVLRTVASEGRKFGLGLCIISQRPARVDKSVLSQCTTQILLKVTNPNDLRAVSNSVEGITAEAEREIANLTIGSALVTGVTDLPLLVKVRPRRTRHGGKAIDVLSQESEDLLAQLESFKEQELLALIKPTTTLQEATLMHDGPVSVELTPALRIVCSDRNGKHPLLFERVDGRLVIDVETMDRLIVPDLRQLPDGAIDVLQRAFRLRRFTAEEIAKPSGDDREAALKRLYDEGLLRCEQGSYSLSEDHVFTTLAKHAVYTGVIYERIGYHIKHEAKVEEKALLDLVGQYATIIEHQPCHIVSFRPVQEVKP